MLNSLTHGRDDGLNELQIAILSSPDNIAIELSDDGAPFDPMTDAPAPDLHAALNDRLIGGLGIHLIREMVDDIKYRRETGRNLLTLIVRRP